MFYVVIRLTAYLLFKALFRMQIYGRENIPKQGGFILASNHISYLDPPAVAAACPRILSFLAKEELFNNVAFGWFIANLNTFPLKTHTADFRSLRWAIQELKRGKALVIFPEGRRTFEGEIVEPMIGVGFLAAKTSVPIVPAFVEGSNRALPIHSKFIRPKKIKVHFGRPIKLEEFPLQLKSDEFYQLIARRTMEAIRNLRRGDRYK